MEIDNWKLKLGKYELNIRCQHLTVRNSKFRTENHEIKDKISIQQIPS